MRAAAILAAILLCCGLALADGGAGVSPDISREGPRYWIALVKPWNIWVLRATLASAILIPLRFGGMVRPAGRRFPAWAWCAGAAIVAFALWIRLGFTHAGFLHENFHGGMYVFDAIDERLFGRPFRSLLGKYGWNTTALLSPFFQLFPKEPETLFRIDGTLGGLTAGLVVLAAWWLFADAPAALFAGLSHAVWPLLARTAPTENVTVLVTMGLYLALVNFAAWARTGSWLFWWGTLLALNNVVQTQLPPMTAPAAFLLGGFVYRGWALAGRWQWWAGWAGFAVLCGWHYIVMAWISVLEPLLGIRYDVALYGMFRANHLLFDFTLTPVWYGVAALGGMAWGLATRRLDAAFLLVCYAVVYPLYMPLQSCYPNKMRFQADILPLLCPFIGYFIARGITILPLKSLRIAMAVLVAAAMISIPWRYRYALTAPTNQDFEWEFIRDHHDALPKECLLLMFESPTNKVIVEFPDYYLWYKGWRVRFGSVQRFLAQPPGRRDWSKPIILYRGPHFFISPDGSLGRCKQPNPYTPVQEDGTCNGTQDWYELPLWEEINHTFQVRALAERTFDSNPIDYHVYPGRRFRLGFYQLLPPPEPSSTAGATE